MISNTIEFNFLRAPIAKYSVSSFSDEYTNVKRSDKNAQAT